MTPRVRSSPGRTMQTRGIVPFGGKNPPPKPDPLFHGGKGASLLRMTTLGLKVPPGFILTTECYLLQRESFSAFRGAMEEEIQKSIHSLEEVLDRRFADPHNPLLLSVRSGAPVSMPGMMDTILNLGLYPENVENIAKVQGELFAWGSFLRLLSQFTSLILKPPTSKKLVEILDMGTPPRIGVEARVRARKALRILEESHTPFPLDPWDQLWQAIEAVFSSWECERARVYRKIQNIPETLGTACTIQAMVFGNRDEHSGTGVAFSRDPSTGERRLSGEYLPMGQGEDVVAGIRTPLSIRATKTNKCHPEVLRSSLEELHPDLFEELQQHMINLEKDVGDTVDVEFTIESGTLYFLQCRSAKRSAEAALRIACDMEREGMITETEMFSRITPDHVKALLRPHFEYRALSEAKHEGMLLAKGLPAGPGAASGIIAFEPPCNAEREPFILVRRETSPEDVGAMAHAAGVLTIHGGMSSHAALVARQLGIVCIVGCEDVVINPKDHTIWFGKKSLHEGDWISLDGTLGDVYAGKLQTTVTNLEDSLLPPVLLRADKIRRLGVRANADTPEQAMIARMYGAEGIGLARTEHMFFGEDRLPLFQRLILSKSEEERRTALKKIEQLQTYDFYGLLLAMDGLPVTIRTIDPPLHEFLPKKEEDIEALAGILGVSPTDMRTRITEMHESNPMLGFRGCRLGILHPEIPKMQVRALISAACQLKHGGQHPRPEIMIPLTSTAKELMEHRKVLEEEIEKVKRQFTIPSSTRHGDDSSHPPRHGERSRIHDVECPIGTMIEVPRAALVAEDISLFADFLSFGTNDLTQLTYGISRDDASTFLPQYIEKGIYPEDPFVSIDREGVGRLMAMAIIEARTVKPDLRIGICGEHGGDPSSIHLCEELSLTYVSCSPYRVPIARLAAAQAQ